MSRVVEKVKTFPKWSCKSFPKRRIFAPNWFLKILVSYAWNNLHGLNTEKNNAFSTTKVISGGCVILREGWRGDADCRPHEQEQWYHWERTNPRLSQSALDFSRGVLTWYSNTTRISKSDWIIWPTF